MYWSCPSFIYFVLIIFFFHIFTPIIRFSLFVLRQISPSVVHFAPTISFALFTLRQLPPSVVRFAPTISFALFTLRQLSPSRCSFCANYLLRVAHLYINHTFVLFFLLNCNRPCRISKLMLISSPKYAKYIFV